MPPLHVMTVPPWPTKVLARAATGAAFTSMPVAELPSEPAVEAGSKKVVWDEAVNDVNREDGRRKGTKEKKSKASRRQRPVAKLPQISMPLRHLLPIPWQRLFNRERGNFSGGWRRNRGCEIGGEHRGCAQSSTDEGAFSVRRAPVCQRRVWTTG